MRPLLKFSIVAVLTTWAGLCQAQQQVRICTDATPFCAPVTSGNPLPVSASVSASITGFAPAAYGTPIAVTNSNTTGTLPAGAVVVAYNVGATNTAYCALGGTATTSDVAIPPNSWFAFTVGAATQLSCITSTSTTTVNMAGGSGLPTGAGGGGGGGSSGAVFGPTAVGSAAANPPVLTGGTADGTAAGNVGVWKIVSGVGSANVAQVNGTTTLVNTGAVGAGAQRVAVGTDTATIAGSAPGTAGAASTNVLSVQGIASMTPILATLQASAATAIGKVDPNTIATWGLAATTQNVTAPTNGMVVMGQFTTSPTTITTTNVSPLQMDNAGNLLVNIKAGAGSGGTAIADNAAFTQGTTNETPIGCFYTAGTYTNITTTHVGVMQCDITGHPLVNPGTIAPWGLTPIGGTTSSPTNAMVAGCQYNASPPTYTTGDSGAVQCTIAGSVHTTVDNTNANGQATMANSSPVVIASNQSNVPIGAASGSIASGAIASGAVASGAYASGAFATGSFLNATAGDPCMFQAKTNVAISTASGTVALVTGVSAKKIYVCSLSLVTSGAIAVSLAEGSSSTCGTSNQAAVLGVATNGTAANGISLAANGGLTLGNGGGTVAQTATAANYLCLFQSGTTQMAGNLTYVQQ